MPGIALRLSGLFSLIPATIFLTLSFFVILVNRKLDSKPLKVFGFTIITLLWLCATLFLATGIRILFSGKYPPMRMMPRQKHPMMQGMMERRPERMEMNRPSLPPMEKE